MKEDFLRPPRALAEYTADALRLLSVLAVVAAAIWLSPTDAGILAFAVPAVMAPRALGIRPWFDVAIGATVLVAAGSNVLDLYRTIAGWDLVVHFACTGVLAAAGYLVLARVGVVPAQGSPSFSRHIPLVICTMLGLAVSALWEMVEWAGREFITDEIFVTYQDTIGDMALGGLGALAAAFLVATVRLERPKTTADPQNLDRRDH